MEIFCQNTLQMVYNIYVWYNVYSMERNPIVFESVKRVAVWVDESVDVERAPEKKEAFKKLRLFMRSHAEFF